MDVSVYSDCNKGVMGMREKLIELLDDIQRCGEDYTESEIYGMRIPDTVSNENVADYLIANGVTIPVRCEECKSCMFCYPEKQIGKEPTPGWYCKEQKSYRRPDDFCSYGERRTDV